MVKLSSRAILGRSLVRGAIITFNLAAAFSFFFIQLGALFFIIPAVVIDAMYVLSQEKIGPRRDAVAPSRQLMSMSLMIVLGALVVFGAIFLLAVLRTA